MNERFKANLWGGEGSGKTLFGMGMPKPIILDSERGTGWYVGQYPDAQVEHIFTFDETCKRVRELVQNPMDRLTLVIDSVSMLHKDLIDKWTGFLARRNQTSAGFKVDYYDLQPKDYRLINADWDKLIRELARLDMNVILLSREGDAYAKGEFMKSVGVKPECYKGIPYFVDVNLHLTRGKNGEFMAKVDGGDNLDNGPKMKDRTNCFPAGKTFPFTVKNLSEMFGSARLNREAVAVKYATPEQCEQLQQLFDLLFIEPDKVKRDLAKYEASEIKDLTFDDATKIIDKLNTQYEKEKKERDNNANV